jgi:hypothetical protein
VGEVRGEVAAIPSMAAMRPAAYDRSPMTRIERYERPPRERKVVAIEAPVLATLARATTPDGKDSRALMLARRAVADRLKRLDGG